MKLTIIDIAYHRNGVTGVAFHAVVFNDGKSIKIGIVFETDGHCAVFDLAALAKGDIACGSNSYRGDVFESGLRMGIKHFSNPAQPSKEPTNADRVQWAEEALTVFTARTFGGDHPHTMDRHDLEDAIGDLICNLMHYAHRRGFDTGSIIQSACGHFGFEMWEEAQRP